MLPVSINPGCLQFRCGMVAIVVSYRPMFTKENRSRVKLNVFLVGIDVFLVFMSPILQNRVIVVRNETDSRTAFEVQNN